MTFGANKDALCLVKIVLQILYLIMGLFCNFPAFAENLLDVYVLPESVPAGFEAGPKAVRGIFSAAKAFLPMAGSIGRAE